MVTVQLCSDVLWNSWYWYDLAEMAVGSPNVQVLSKETINVEMHYMRGMISLGSLWEVRYSVHCSMLWSTENRCYVESTALLKDLIVLNWTSSWGLTFYSFTAFGKSE